MLGWPCCCSGVDEFRMRVVAALGCCSGEIWRWRGDVRGRKSVARALLAGACEEPLWNSSACGLWPSETVGVCQESGVPWGGIHTLWVQLSSSSCPRCDTLACYRALACPARYCGHAFLLMVTSSGMCGCSIDCPTGTKGLWS